MKLFHGGIIIVNQPAILKTQRLLDFGKGFYTTTNQNQAERWAVIKKKRLSKKTKSIVTLSLYEANLLTKEETIKRLKVHKLYDQISFHNNAVLKELVFFNNYEI